MRTLQTRLPRLAGRWVAAYRAIWCTLALVAAAVMAQALYSANASPTVLGLRLLKSAIVILVCTILLKRRRDDPVAALLSLAFLTWTIASNFDFVSADLVLILLDRVRFLLFALALLLFPDGTWRPAWTRHAAIASGAVFVLGIVEAPHIVPTRLFLPLAIGCIAAAVSGLIARFRTAQSMAIRQQLKWIALGLVCGIGLILSARACAALASASPTLLAMPALWEAMFQTGVVVIALGFLVSLLRYRLFDAETAISRSAAFAGLTIAVVATFAGTEAAIEWVGQQYLGMGIGNVSAAMAAAVAAVLLNPLHSRISDWAEIRFQRDLVFLRRDLPEILEDFAASASVRRLAAVILRRINHGLHATRSALIVPGGKVIGANGVASVEVQQWSRDNLRTGGPVSPRDPGDQLFPVRLELRDSVFARAGWLLLGPRPDGSLYGKEELNALHALLPAIRRAITWASAREAWRIAARRKWQLLRREIAELRASAVH